MEAHGGDEETVVERRRFAAFGNDFKAAPGKDVSRFAHHAKWILERTVVGVTRLAVATVEFAVICALKFYVLFPFAWIGVFAIFARRLFIWSIPTLLKLTGPLVFTINIIIDWLTLVLDEVVLVVRAIEGVVNAIAKLFPGHHSVFNSIPNYPSVFQITDAEFRATLKAIPPTCVRFQSASSISFFFSKYGLHSTVCPAVRYTYPIEWVYTIVSGFFKPWAYYGDAAPFPNTPGQNCESDGAVTNTDFLCAGIGVGYIILDLALPILIIAIFLFVTVTALYDIVSAGVYTFYIAAGIGIDTVVILIDSLFY
jgi:hypothetical protein